MRKIICLLTVFFLFTSSSSVSAAVNISIDSYPSTVTISQEFSVSITANNLLSGTSYYIKGRIGIGSELNKAETNNINNSSPDDWLADTDSWSKFPQITIGENISTWSGTLKLRAKSTAADGQNSLKIRIKKTTTDTSYDSEVYEITLQPAPTSTPTPTPTPTPMPTSVPTSVPTSNPTAAPTSVPNIAPTKTPVPAVTSKPANTPTVFLSPTKIQTFSSPTSELIPTANNQGSVLGEDIESKENITNNPATVSSQSRNNNRWIFLVFLGGGLLFISAAVILTVRKTKSSSGGIS